MKKFEGFDREDLIVIGYYAGSLLIGAANAAVSFGIAMLPIGKIPKILAIVGNEISGLVTFGNFSEMCGRVKVNRPAKIDGVDVDVGEFVNFFINNPDEFAKL